MTDRGEVDDVTKYLVSEDDEKKGSFRRTATAFHGHIRSSASSSASSSSVWPAEAGRYHLYVSYGCPWAHRTLIMLKLKGLEHAIGVTFLGHKMDGVWGTDSYAGWLFAESRPDPLHENVRSTMDLYRINDPNYSQKKLSVPILWDKKTNKIVNNESSEIIVMLNEEFNEFAKHPELDLRPKVLRQRMEEVDSFMYPCINDGVYRCGFAKTQEAYDAAIVKLFDALDRVEQILSKSRYIAGDQLTLSDIRLFPTVFRFDYVYHTHFKANKKRIVDYPHLFAWAREIYQTGDIADTINLKETIDHYFWSHMTINPTRIIAAGPTIDWDGPHRRG